MIKTKGDSVESIEGKDTMGDTGNEETVGEAKTP